MPYDIHPKNERKLTVTYKKEDGTPGTVQGVPAWKLSDDKLAALVPAADGMSAVIKHNGTTGKVTLTVTADGDLGPAVFPVIVTEEFDMAAALGAKTGTLAAAAEEPIPA